MCGQLFPLVLDSVQLKRYSKVIQKFLFNFWVVVTVRIGLVFTTGSSVSACNELVSKLVVSNFLKYCYEL